MSNEATTETLSTGDLSRLLSRTVTNLPPGTDVTVRENGVIERGEIAASGYGVVTDPGHDLGRPQVGFTPITDGQRGETRQVFADRVRRLDFRGPDASTKVVTMIVTARFHGEYHDLDSVGSVLGDWIDGGLDDRDDLRSWSTHVASVTEFYEPDDRD